MRIPGLVAAAILWQSASLVNIGAPAAPEHLRFERAVDLPAGAAGFTCATLDAEALAHTSSAAHNDLRLYRAYPGSPAQTEVPYLLTESGPEPVADAEVAAEHLRRVGNALRFDLRMPPRPYSEVQLHLRVRNFVGTVLVTGDAAQGRRTSPGSLGNFGIFDLSAKGLGRWTILPLAETISPVLHVVLTLRTPEGRPIAPLAPELVEGAAVPPTRERQTLYTTVAQTGSIVRQGTTSVATLDVPAHVPVERVRFVLAPAFHADFYRAVRVRARPDGDPAAGIEVIDAGAIQHVRLPSGDPGLNPIDVSQLSLDATLGTMLTHSATVRVVVQNGDEAALPLRSVALEMRERRLCFLAADGALYTLRYGDPALQAPVYDEAALLEARSTPLHAQLGPERRNPAWRPRRDTRGYLDRHPELFWILVLICGGMMGASALHYVQQRGGTGHG